MTCNVIDLQVYIQNFIFLYRKLDYSREVTKNFRSWISSQCLRGFCFNLILLVQNITSYGLNDLGFEPRWTEIFHAYPDWPRAPSSLLCNEYLISFPVLIRPGCGVDFQPPSNDETKERLLYSPFRSSRPVMGEFYFTWEVLLLFKLYCFQGFLSYSLQ